MLIGARDQNQNHYTHFSDSTLQDPFITVLEIQTPTSCFVNPSLL